MSLWGDSFEWMVVRSDLICTVYAIYIVAVPTAIAEVCWLCMFVLLVRAEKNESWLIPGMPRCCDAAGCCG
jgi:hypothetical protein